MGLDVVNARRQNVHVASAHNAPSVVIVNFGWHDHPVENPAPVVLVATSISLALLAWSLIHVD